MGCYGVSYPDLYRPRGDLRRPDFQGAKPADLPIEQPTSFELVLNLKTAKEPPALIARADEVIE